MLAAGEDGGADLTVEKKSFGEGSSLHEGDEARARDLLE